MANSNPVTRIRQRALAAAATTRVDDHRIQHSETSLPPIPAEIDARANTARLPINYEAARTALAQCEAIDEVAEWADRAEALASYARQARDEELETRARRIRLRAIRRVGELLAEYDARGGDCSKSQTPPTFAPLRGEAAKKAGLSRHQSTTATRIASIPEADFDAVVESGRPPGVNALAKTARVKNVFPIRDDANGSGEVRRYVSITVGEGTVNLFGVVLPTSVNDEIENYRARHRLEKNEAIVRLLSIGLEAAGPGEKQDD